jgi:hypothetical protein
MPAFFLMMRCVLSNASLVDFIIHANLVGVAYHIPRLCGISINLRLQICTAGSCSEYVGICNIMVSNHISEHV